MDDQMRCYRCRASVEASDNWCAQCGAQLRVTAEQSPTGSPPPPPSPGERDRASGARLVGVGGVALVLGTFLPWVEVLGFTANGYSDGQVLSGALIAVPGGILAYAGFFSGEHNRASGVAAAIFAGLAGAAVWVQVDRVVDFAGSGLAHAGVGIWVMAGGALASFVGGLTLASS